MNVDSLDPIYKVRDKHDFGQEYFDSDTVLDEEDDIPEDFSKTTSVDANVSAPVDNVQLFEDVNYSDCSAESTHPQQKSVHSPDLDISDSSSSPHCQKELTPRLIFND